jgi:hypothetical protein
MDSTAIALEKMDGAAFERLCGPVLRKMIPELANLIPSGINAAGQTIKSLSDGFCFIGGKHLATAHITTNGSDLTTKWLYDGDARTMTKGDLIKGINQAEEIYADNSDYRFSIYLVSNRRVDDDLHLKIHQRNTDSFIDVRIIEQRDLVFFLDHEAEGQYLRKHFLGIDADRISLSLLGDIAKTNLLDYGQENYLKDSHLVNVSGQRKVEERITASKTTVNLLTGDSGFGKSAMCFSMMRAVLESGGVALRVKPAAIEKARSLEDAIQQQLISDYPQIYTHPTDIQNLFRNALIVVDDINKFYNTPAILDKIISWNKEKKAEENTILCPVWPRNLDALDNKAKKTHDYTVVSLGRLSFYDCKSIIQQRINNGFLNLTEQQIHSLIVDTGLDPLLLDFSLELLSDTNIYSESIPSEAIKSFVSDKVKQIHNLYQSPVQLVNQSLAILGEEMLKNRKLDPHLRDIEKWLGRGSEEYKIVTMLAAQRQLFSFDDEGKCFFRHDRVRDYLLSLAASGLFNDFVANIDVLTDPYYAEIIGTALATTSMQKDMMESLIQSNPLAVYISLKYLQNEPSEPRRAIVIQVIEAWSAKIAINGVPKAITNAIANALIGFDIKEIGRVTKGFPDSAELQLAKFRNGIWLSGIKFFSFIRYFYPEAPTYWWNTILAHVKSKYLDETIKGLRLNLPDRFTALGIEHAYTLAGFLKEPQLLEVLAVSWKKYSNPQYYVSYLWSTLNSFTKNDRQIVEDVLSYWSTIPEEVKQRRIKDELTARAMDNQIKFLDWDFSEEQLALLIELSRNTALHEILALLFAKIDHPSAFVVVLDIEMRRDESYLWYEDWDERWDRSKTRRRLSESSLNYLQQEFFNPTAHAIRRYLAWRYWTGNAEPDIVLKKLQKIVDENDCLFNDSVLWRVKHHDQTATDAAKYCIARKPWLVKVLADIWNEEVKIFFTEWFNQRIHEKNTEVLEHGLELLALLDNEDACQLLINQWEQIKWHPRAIETALFLSTPATKSVADQEIRRLGFEPSQPMPDFYYGNMRGLYFSEGDGLSEEQKANLLLLAEQFKYLYMHYGAKYKNKGERLTREKLETLLPYLPILDSFSIYQFAIDSLRIGAPDLCYEKFYPLIDNNHRKKIRLTTEDLKWDVIQKYRELEKDNKVYIDYWIEEVEKLGVTNEMLAEALQSFSEKYHNTNAFFIIALILEDLGTRKDIAIMDRFLLDSQEERRKVEYWKANAVFLIKRRSLI